MADEMWVEKYRPKTLSEVVGQKHIVGRLIKLVKNVQAGKATVPHMLLAGPSGTGKTTVAQAFFRDLYGPDFKMKELNASDDRGIDVVRTEIKKFCRTSTLNDTLNIVFLDESDGLTAPAQAALRRTMERYAKNSRFILTCNNPNQIIDPIRGRVAILNFFPLKAYDIKGLINRITAAENHKISSDAATLIATLCRGDARAALNALHYLANTQDGEVKEKDIYDHMWRIDISELTELVKMCLKVGAGNVESRLGEIDSLLQKFYGAGYTNQNIVDGLFYAVKDMEIKPQLKAKLIYQIGDLDHKMTIGCNQTIQMRSFLYGIVFHRLKSNARRQ